MLAPSPKSFDTAKIMRRAWQLVRQARAELESFNAVLRSNDRCGRFGGEAGTPPAIRSFSDALKFAWAEAKAPKIDDVLANITAAYLSKLAA